MSLAAAKARKPPAAKPAWPRILAAVDFSPASRAAFEAARGLARDLGAGVVLVHVTPKALRKGPDAARRPGPYLTPPEAAVQDAARLTAEWAEELRKDDVFVKALNPTGPAAKAIVDVAVKHGCGAIVLATTGRSALKALLVGSTAREVIRTSPLPVLAVPARQPKGAPAAAPPAKSLLVAVDFSPGSDLAYEAALRLAKDLKCGVRALHVVPLAMSTEPFPPGAGLPVPILAEDEASSLGQLAAMASRARRQGVGVVPSVQVGHAASVILAEARTTGASLIVLGTHGRSGARRFFLGSVAQAVAQAADRPVLVVPGPGRERGDWRR